ncbi:MAG: sigma 54-interacting transcriptional regulator [Myxococcota bacterium]
MDDWSESEETELEAGAEALARTLLVIDVAGAPTTVALDGPGATTVGRDASCDVVVDDGKLSRHHFTIHGDGIAVPLTVADAGSTNGTRLNGHPLSSERVPLHGGDLVAAGRTTFTVVAPEPNPASPPRDPTFVVEDAATRGLYQLVDRVAPTDASVLIRGETGAGKEVVAGALHARSPRAAQPYVRLNCASLSENLLSSELFGHERGAFTGADRTKVGYFEAAHRGTLLLDEIGELSPAMQAKLLRVLEVRAVTRVGATTEIPVDVRVVCATHRDLGTMVADGTFREDLFYRISTFTLEVPPLRARPRELEVLAERFLAAQAQRQRRVPPTLGPAARAALARHHWPGNVRELRNAMEHACVLCLGDTVEPSHLPASVFVAEEGDGPATVVPAGGVKSHLEQVERARIVAALEAEHGNQTRSAKRLEISRRALIYKMEKYGLKKKPG